MSDFGKGGLECSWGKQGLYSQNSKRSSKINGRRGGSSDGAEWTSPSLWKKEWREWGATPTLVGFVVAQYCLFLFFPSRS